MSPTDLADDAEHFKSAKFAKSARVFSIKNQIIFSIMIISLILSYSNLTS